MQPQRRADASEAFLVELDPDLHAPAVLLDGVLLVRSSPSASVNRERIAAARAALVSAPDRPAEVRSLTTVSR
jgi:hypothetical protein